MALVITNKKNNSGKNIRIVTYEFDRTTEKIYLTKGKNNTGTSTLDSIYSYRTLKPHVMINAGFFASGKKSVGFTYYNDNKTNYPFSGAEWNPCNPQTDSNDYNYGKILYVQAAGGPGSIYPYKDLHDSYYGLNGQSKAYYNARVTNNTGLLFAITGFEHSGQSPTAERPRTMIGLKSNGNVIFLVVDPLGANTGLTIAAARTHLENMGAITTLNLDGGGSSNMLYNGTRQTTQNTSEPNRAVGSVFETF